MSVQFLYISIQSRVIKQERATIYYPEIIGLQNKHVQQMINHTIVQLTQTLINEQHQQQGVDYFAAMVGTYEIKTNERGVLSLTLSNYAIAPQHANGLTITKSLTFNVETGKVYQLKDLFKQKSNDINRLSMLVKEQIHQRDLPTINEFIRINPNQDFYIADKCLVLFFQPLEITPHYYGTPMFPISVYEIEDIIEESGPLGKMLAL